MSSTNIFSYDFNQGEKGHVTLHGLEKWLCHMYEHLGWMTLAYEHKSYDKVVSYINGCEKLRVSIEDRHERMPISEQKKDLEILSYKVDHLINVCDKLFDKDMLSREICKKCKSGKDSTSVKDSVIGFAGPSASSVPVAKEPSREDLALKKAIEEDAEKYGDKFIMNSRQTGLSMILYKNGIKELTQEIPSDFFTNVRGATLLLKDYYMSGNTWDKYLMGVSSFREEKDLEDIATYLKKYFTQKGGAKKSSKKASKKSSKKASKKYSKKGSKLTGGAKKYSKKVSKKRSKKSSKKSKKN